MARLIFHIDLVLFYLEMYLFTTPDTLFLPNSHSCPSASLFLSGWSTCAKLHIIVICMLLKYG